MTDESDEVMYQQMSGPASADDEELSRSHHQTRRRGRELQQLDELLVFLVQLLELRSA